MPKVINIWGTGYKVPEGAVYVGRANLKYHLPASKWGNPFKLPSFYSHQPKATKLALREAVVRLYRDYLDKRPELKEAARRELKGKDLVCWCHNWDGIGTNPMFCHADVLLEVANAEK